MINYINDPINAVIDVCEELYPELEAESIGYGLVEVYKAPLDE